MKTYTIKEFAEGKKAVKIENEEQWNKLNKVHALCGHYNINYYTNDKSYTNDENYLKLNSWEVLEFSQLNFEDELVVGKWYRITKKGNTIKYIKYLKTQADGYFWCSEHISNMYGNYGGTFSINDTKDLAEDSLEEIQQYLPENHPDLIKKDTKESTMKKEIIGYKLKEEFLHCKEYAAHIGEYNNRYDTQEYLLKESDRTLKCGIIRLKEAGVLDLWFEPVYKEEFKKDDYVTVVSTSSYDYDSSCGDTRPVVGKIYKIYNVSTNYVNLDVPNGIIAIKSSDLRKATEDEIKTAQIQLPTINGKQCVDNGNKTITCGCTTKSFDWILGVEYAMDDYVNISDTKVTQKEIEQIVEYINNK